MVCPNHLATSLTTASVREYSDLRLSYARGRMPVIEDVHRCARARSPHRATGRDAETFAHWRAVRITARPSD